MSVNAYKLDGTATVTVDGQTYQLKGYFSYRAVLEPAPPRLFDWCNHTITATLKRTGRNRLGKWFKQFDPAGTCYVRPRSAKMRRARRLKYWRPE